MGGRHPVNLGDFFCRIYLCVRKNAPESYASKAQNYQLDGWKGKKSVFEDLGPGVRIECKSTNGA